MWCLRNSEFLWVCHVFKHRDKHPKSSNNKPHGFQEISHKWRKTLVFWFKAVHLMHQAWKHHASLIHQSCDKCHNHGNTMEVWLQAVYQACHKCCTSWKHNGNLTPSSSPNLSRMLHKLKKEHAIQAQGQTSQVLQIHHMPPSNCSERDRLKKQKKISQKWRKTLVFWFEAVHLMHQAWKHHASLIHQSCDKCHNHGNTIEIWLQAVHQTCYKCCTSWKHHGNLTPSSSPKLSQSVSQPVS